MSEIPIPPSAPGSEQLGTCENRSVNHLMFHAEWPGHVESEFCVGWRPLDPPKRLGKCAAHPGGAHAERWTCACSWRPLDPPEQLGRCTAAGCFGSTPHDPSGHCEGTWRPLDPGASDDEGTELPNWTERELRLMKRNGKLQADAIVLQEQLYDRAEAAEAELATLRAALDQWMAPDTWRLADGSEVGIPEGTLIRCGIAKRSDDHMSPKEWFGVPATPTRGSSLPIPPFGGQ